MAAMVTYVSTIAASLEVQEAVKILWVVTFPHLRPRAYGV